MIINGRTSKQDYYHLLRLVTILRRLNIPFNNHYISRLLVKGIDIEDFKL